MQSIPEASHARLGPRAVERIRALSRLRPSLGVVLGSGFAHVIESMRVEGRMAYRDLPGFTSTGVKGHPGEVVVGRLGATPVLVLNGRVHYYEGHGMEAVTTAVRILAACGVKDLLLTNAAGGVNRSFRRGDFMMVQDHINLMGENPLRGPVPSGAPRFVDMTRAYDPQLIGLLRRAGRRVGLKLRCGVYLAVSGPSYETPAEIRAFARWGADAVGMSTVPEVLVARQLGMRVAAVSCITNLAAGRTRQPLSHDEVLLASERVRPAATRLLQAFVELYGQARA